MKLFFWTLRIIAGSFLMLWFPMVGFAFTPGAFVVSPAEVDLGTVRVLPGSSAGPYAFTIAVVGGPVADPQIETESADFYAICDAPWLTLNPANGTAPGSITATATVSDTMASGVWTANVTILSGLDPSTQPVNIPVTITVIRSIGDLLTVSPSTLDLQVTDQNVSEQIFPITIANADPNKPADFTWSAQTDVSWLVLYADEGLENPSVILDGSGNTTVSLKVDPDAIYMTTDTDYDGIPDSTVGTVTFRSSLNADAVTLTVNASILTSDESAEPSVSPPALYWKVEKSPDSSIVDFENAFNSQSLQVSGFESGWTAACDVGFVSVALYDSSDLTWSHLGVVTITNPSGWVEVTPDAGILFNMDAGVHTGYITVSSLDGESQVRIPLTIDIREATSLEVADSVSPSQLEWTIEKDPDAWSGDFSDALSSQRLHVLGFDSGWTADIDVGFVSFMLYDSTGTTQDAALITTGSGWVEVTPNAGTLFNMGYGTHTGHITVSSLDGESQIQVPFTINIRETTTSETEASVSPSQLEWTAEKGPDTWSGDFSDALSSQRLHVLGFDSGWTADIDVGFVSFMLYDSTGTTQDAALITTSSGWVEVIPNAGTLFNMGYGTHTGYITVSSLDGASQIQIPLTINIKEPVLMTVSPTKLDLQITDQNASEQTFPITIANADPNNSNDFTWSAQTDVSWLVLSASEGSGNATLSLRVDPDAMYVNSDSDGDGIPDAVVGTVTFRSNLDSETITLTVNATILSSAEPSVSPSQLYWTVEKSTADAALTFSSQRLQLFGFESGWTAASDMGFVSVSLYDATGSKPGGELGQVIITDPYGWVEVTPAAEILSAMAYGTYTGYITVSDLDREIQFRIPITINIREPGDAVYLPVPEFRNSYSQMEAAESSLINVQFPVPEDFEYYPTAATCQAAGGTWMNPDNTLGSLDEYCSLNQHAYVLLERQDMEPGMVYGMTKTGELALAYENGIKVSGADALSYADGPVSYIPFGPLQMIGSYGTVIVSLRVGTNLTSAVEIQRLQVNLQTPDGQWTVTEAYKGGDYVYDFAPLTIERIDGQSGYGYTCSWEDMPVNVSIGDGSTWLYQLYFEQNGINYTYQIQSLSGNQMSGQWQYTWRDTSSDWETFEAQRQLWQLSFP